MIEKRLNNLISRYPSLNPCKNNINNVYLLMRDCFDRGGKILCCGNGGSSADCDHFVGELMKGFLKKRPLSKAEKDKFTTPLLADSLQQGLPCISLTAQSSLITAYINDCNADFVFAQQVYALAEKNDLLLVFSTSGNSKNIVFALECAKAKGIKTVSVTGTKESECAKFSDICIKIPETETYKIQELTLPIYHCLAAMIEEYYFTE